MNRKEAEKKILKTIQEYEKSSSIKTNWIDVVRSNPVGFTHNGTAPKKNPTVSKVTIRGELP